MIKLEITAQEKNVLMMLTKPSSFKRLYLKLDEMESMDAAIDEFFAKSNYSKVTDIYVKKGIIKQSIIKNQLALLRIYQSVITSNKINDNKKIVLEISKTLVPLLIETLTYALISITRRKERNKMRKEDALMEQCCDSLMRNLSNNISSFEIYEYKKILKTKKNIVDFNDFI